VDFLNVPPELLKCYLLLYVAYYPQCFHFHINSPPSSKPFITTADLDCLHIHLCQVKTQLPSQVTVGGFSAV
jgi:hypothetical protein